MNHDLDNLIMWQPKPEEKKALRLAFCENKLYDAFSLIYGVSVGDIKTVVSSLKEENDEVPVAIASDEIKIADDGDPPTALDALDDDYGLQGLALDRRIPPKPHLPQVMLHFGNYRWEYKSVTSTQWKACSSSSWWMSNDAAMEREYYKLGSGAESEMEYDPKNGRLKYYNRYVRRVTLGDKGLRKVQKPGTLMTVPDTEKAAAQVWLMYRDPDTKEISVLIQKRSWMLRNAGKLNTPGGKVEKIKDEDGNEILDTFANTAIKELYEEANIMVDKSSLRAIGRPRSVTRRFQSWKFFCFTEDPLLRIGRGSHSNEMDNSFGYHGHKWVKLSQVFESTKATDAKDIWHGLVLGDVKFLENKGFFQYDKLFH